MNDEQKNAAIDAIAQTVCSASRSPSLTPEALSTLAVALAEAVVAAAEKINAAS